MQRMEELLAQIKAVDLSNGAQEPEEEVKDGETVVGIMPDDLKKFFVVRGKLIDEMNLKCEEVSRRLTEIFAELMPNLSEIIGTSTSELLEQLDPEDLFFLQLHELDLMWMDIVNRLFWYAVKETFPQTAITYDNIAIRKGWQIVTCESKQESEFISDKIAERLAEIFAVLLN